MRPITKKGNPLRAQRKYLTVTDVQRELGLTARQVQQLIDSCRLPAFRILGQWRIERELLDQMVNDLYEEEIAASAAGRGSPPAQDAPEPPTEPAPGLPEPETAARTATAWVPRPAPDAIGGLTEQQQRILELIGQGLSNAEIAASLAVEISTVKSHVSRILLRCALRDREQLIVLAWKSGLMSCEQP
jgi:DNA-binding NarL/FixJ family response regulator